MVLALTAAASAALGIALLKLFLRPGAAYLLVSVEVASLIRSLWSCVTKFLYIQSSYLTLISRMFRKPLSGSPQSVASEAVGLFVLFPFQLSRDPFSIAMIFVHLLFSSCQSSLSSFRRCFQNTVMACKDFWHSRYSLLPALSFVCVSPNF